MGATTPNASTGKRGLAVQQHPQRHHQHEVRTMTLGTLSLAGLIAVGMAALAACSKQVDGNANAPVARAQRQRHRGGAAGR